MYLPEEYFECSESINEEYRAKETSRTESRIKEHSGHNVDCSELKRVI